MGRRRVAGVEDVERDFLQVHRGGAAGQPRRAKRPGLDGRRKCRQSDVVLEAYSREREHRAPLDEAARRGVWFDLERFPFRPTTGKWGPGAGSLFSATRQAMSYVVSTWE